MPNHTETDTKPITYIGIVNVKWVSLNTSAITMLFKPLDWVSKSKSMSYNILFRFAIFKFKIYVQLLIVNYILVSY